MVKFNIFTPAAEDFIFLLEQEKNIIWKRTWNIGEKTIGVFFIEVFSTSVSADSALLNVVVEHDKKENICQIWIEPFGTAYSSPDRKMRDLIQNIGHIATKYNWRFERVPTSYRGNTCPYCNATYVYDRAKSMGTTTRVCQNCGKQFDPHEPIETKREWGEIRNRRTPCPYCNAAYLYNKSHLREDGTVICQNCGSIFQLPIDDWTQYSYDWYQEDNEMFQ